MIWIWGKAGIPAVLCSIHKGGCREGVSEKRQKMVQALNEDLQSENTESLYHNIIIIKLNWFPDKMGKYRTQEKTSTFISLVKSVPDEQS